MPDTLDQAIDALGGKSVGSTSGDPLDAAVDQVTTAGKSRLRSSMFEAVRTTPDEFGKAKRLERTTGIPADVVSRNMLEVQQQAEVRAVDSLAQRFPKLAESLSYPEFAKLARDDIDTLSEIENRVGGNTMTSSGKRTVRGDEFTKLVRDTKERNPAMSWDDARQITAQHYDVDNQSDLIGGKRKGPAPTLSNIASGLKQSTLSGFENVRQGLRYWMADLLGLEITQADAAKRYGQSKFEADLARPEFDSTAGALAYGGAENVLQNAPALAAALFTRNPQLALGIGTAQTGLQAYPKYRERGGSVLEASTGATLEGALEYWTEKIPVNFLTQNVGKIPLWKLIAGDQAREQVTEQIATHTQDLVDYAIANPNKSFGEYMRERPGAAAQTAVAVLMQGLAVAGAGPLAAKMRPYEQDAAVATNNAQALQQLLNIATRSKTRERDPQSFQQFVDHANADNPVQDIWLNPTRMAQAGVDLETLASVSPSFAQQIGEAIDTGGDVRIPVAELMTVLPQTGLEEAVIQHAKVDPNGMSQDEANAYMQGQLEEVKHETERVLAEHEADQQWTQGKSEIEAAIMQKLRQTDRFTDDVNSAYAAMFSSFYTVMAHKIGITPQEMFKQYQLDVAAQPVVGANTLFDRGGELPVSTSPIREAVAEDFSGGGIVDLLRRKNWAILTAENPNGQAMSAEENAARMATLKAELAAAGIKATDVLGKYGNEEHSLALVGVTPEQASEIGKRYGQQVVLTPHGFLYPDGTVNPATGVIQHAETPEDFYSVLPDGSIFSINIDFDTRVPYQQAMVDDGSASMMQKAAHRVKEMTAPIRRLVKNLTTSEQRKITDKTALKVIEQLDALPDAKEMAAVAWAGRAKRGWYEGSARAISAVFREDAPRFASLLAAMSPQVSVEANLYNALSTWRGWIAAGRPTDREHIIDIMAANVMGTGTRESVLESWINNSVRALASDDFGGLILSGPKVNSFFRNLIGESEEVTNDAWMANYALVDQTLFAGTLLASGTDPGKRTGYLAMNARVREAAKLLSKITGETWTPAEVQETIWSWAKTLYELRDAAGEERTTLRLLNDGALTDELINATPDFGSLFLEGRFGEILREAGYGERLEALGERPVRDSAEQPGEVAGAQSQAEPFAAEAQRRLVNRAARRLEKLREQRAIAAAAKLTERDNGRGGGEPGLVEAQREAAQAAGRSQKLIGLPDQPMLIGGQWYVPGPVAAAHDAAQDYMDRAKMDFVPPRFYVEVDKERATKIAQAFDEMKHEPENPEVRAAYEAMIKETLAQYQAIKRTGLKIEFITPDMEDPYAATPRLAITDVVKNNHLWVFPTDSGFGGSESAHVDISGNPLLTLTDEYIDGKQLRANDVFRIVHDYFGHIKDGNGFRAGGEENAWRSHASMFSPLARRAMTTETRGQNSWVNFGPFGYKNRTASAGDTQYAPQKIGLLPEWVSEEGRADPGPTYGQGSVLTRVMYHGSNAEFDKFLKPDGKGIYFTSDKEYATGYADARSSLGGTPVVHEVTLNLQNPLVIDGEDDAQWEKFTRHGFNVDELIADGYDGVIAKYANGEVEAMVVDPQQISAAGKTYNQYAPLKSAVQGVVYHGTDAEFEKFDMAKARDGAHWFVADASHAATFGKAQPYYVNITHPYEIWQDDLDAAWDAEHPDGEQDDRNLLPRDFVSKFVEKAKAEGFDGLIIREMGDRDGTFDMFLPFSADQIEKFDEQGALAEAKALGYEGKDSLEAQEWIQAVEKGLDMSQEARYARAREMGFNVDKIWYHGSDKAGFKEFRLPKSAKSTGTGIFLGSNWELARSYSGSKADAPIHTAQELFNNPELVEGLEIEKKNTPEGVRYSVNTGHNADYQYVVDASLKEVLEFLDNLTFKQPGNYELFARTPDVFEIDWKGRNWADGPGEEEWRLMDTNGEVIDYAYSEEDAEKFVADNPGASYEKALRWDSYTTDNAAREGRGMGVDATLIKDVADPGPHGYGGEHGDVLVIYDPANIRSIYAAFDPAKSDSDNILSQPGSERGQITFSSDVTKSPSVIQLFRNADLSTMLHEGGHFFLEVMTHVASQPNAPKAVIDDLDRVFKWFGVEGSDFKERMTNWGLMSIDEKRPMHEQFARGFEAYLFEGRSPSVELQGFFARFRAWLINVYRALKNLNVELTDEVRGVFDRMIATEEQIAVANTARGYSPLFDTKPEMMTTEEWGAYQALGAEAVQDALSQLQTRSVRDMQWLNNARRGELRRLQRDAADKRRAIRKEVEAEVNAEPIYAAMLFIQRGQLADEPRSNRERRLLDDIAGRTTKLSLPILKEMYGNGPAAIWRYFNAGKFGMVTASEDGLDPNIVAELFGFGSGDEMIRKLLEAPPSREVIDAKTDQRMLEKHGDISDEAALQRAVDKAVHNEARARFVATELRALSRALNPRHPTPAGGSVNVLTKAAKQFAETIVERKKVRDVRPSQYESAEARAAKAADRALRAGKTLEASTEKRNQLINFYAARAANNAIDDVEKGVRYLKRVSGSEKIDPEYRDQIDRLLERFDLRKISNAAAEKRASLAAWIKDQEDRGLTPVIPDELRDEAFRKPYREMTVEEFRGLVDAVRNIEHLGRLKNKLLTAAKQREFDAAVAEIAASVNDNAKRDLPMEIENNQWRDRVKKGLNEFFAWHRKLASLFREFDGFKDGGAAWEYFTRPMNAAGDRETTMREKATKELAAIFKPIIKTGKLRNKLWIPEIKRSISREGRLAIALNMGNEVNRERVLSGEHWSPEQLDAVLRTLNASEWAFVQRVWDYIDSYWSEIAAKEKRVTGVAPEKVPPSPVQTPFGELRGGYFPIKYNPDRSSQAEADDLAEALRQTMQGLYTRASTRRGHTKARVESTGRPLRYDLGVVFEHVNQVIHDLAWHEYLIDANRLLRAGAVDSAVRSHYGPEVLKAIKQGVNDIATGDIAPQAITDKMLAHVRQGSTIVGLGWNLTTSLLQPLGLTQSMVRVGTKWIGKGIARWVGDAAHMQSTVDWINERSEMMRVRGMTMQREINEIRNKVADRGSVLEASYFYLIQKLQMVADIPTWIGQYEKSMAAGKDEATAIALADQAVLDAQGGGQVKDLANVQKGNQAWKLWTNFYSFFNTTLNLTSEAVGRTNFKSPLEIGLLAVDFLLLYSVPAALATIIKSALKGDDDEDKFVRRLIADQLTYLLGTLVFIREGAAAAQAATGLAGSDYTGPASVRLFTELARLSKQIAQGDLDSGLLKALNSTAGTLLHYPAGQVQRTVEGAVALSDGKTENPGVLLVGAPKR